MAAEGWRERNKFVPRARSTVTNKKTGGGGGVKISFPHPPTPTVYSNSKSNMAGRR